MLNSFTLFLSEDLESYLLYTSLIMTSAWSSINNIQVKIHKSFLHSHCHILTWCLYILLQILDLNDIIHCYFDSCTHWRWHQWTGRNAGCFSQWLCNSTVPISRTLTSGAWALVVFQNVQIFKVFFLQELCLHLVSPVVCVFLWILGPDFVRSLFCLIL